MKKNTIWAIVGLMAAALLAITGLQSYWIKNAVDLQSEQFDKDVTIALKLVAQELQEKALADMDHMDELLTVGEKINLDSKSKLTKTSLDFSGLGQKKEDISNATKAYQTYRRFKPKSLEDKINLVVLGELLMAELENRNVYTDYKYKVYETFKDVPPNLIIANGVFQVTDIATNEVTELSEEIVLSKSEYPVSLFDNAGKLVVSFPQKSSVIWGAVLLPLIAAILSVAIVFFCFTYTVQVIFAQKKVSEMKTDFVNNMTHEFKTPIATISLAVDSIVSPMILGKQDKVKRFAGIIKQENKRMLAQVEKGLANGIARQTRF